VEPTQDDQQLAKTLSVGQAIGLGITIVVGSGLLVLPGIAAAAAAGFGRAAEEPDHTALLHYAVLVGVLSLMARLAVPATGP